MKKIISTVMTVAVASACLSAFAACGGTNTEEKPEKPQVRREVLADFEAFDDIYNMMTNYSNISFSGSYTLSTLSDRKEKVKPIDGNSSFEWRIDGALGENWLGYDKTSGTPARIFYNIFDNTKNDGNWGFDWKYLCGTSVDIYNDNDFEIRVSMYNLFYGGFPYNYGSITVPAKSTKTLHVNVNRYFMQKENTRELSVFSFGVDYDKQVLSDGTLYFPQAYVYFDNLTAEILEEDVYDQNGNAIIEKQFSSANEILNFSDEGDLTFMREIGHQYAKESDNVWFTEAWHEGTGSSFHYNTDKSFVAEGNVGSLEWRINPTFQTKFNSEAYRYLTDKNYMEPNALTGITVCGDYLNYINLAYLKDKNAKITVDVFNAGDFDKEVAFGIHDNSGISKKVQTDYPYDYGALYSTDKWYKLKKGEWTTLELDDFSMLDVSNGLARLQLVTSLLDVSEELSFYVNNLRIDYGTTAKSGESAQAEERTDAESTVSKKVYAFDEKMGLVAHMGHSFVNELEVQLVDFDSQKDLNGNSVAVSEEMAAEGVTSGIRLKSYRTLGRAVLTDSETLNWDKNYETLYFWFYNAGYSSVTVTFNNWSVTIPAGRGWQKVIIGAKSVRLENGETKTVTDYSLISSLSKSTVLNGMIDLEDCVGSFLMFKTNQYYEEFYMSAIYGEPFEGEQEA